MSDRPTVRDPAPEVRDPVPITRDPARPRVAVVHRRVRCPVCGGVRIYCDGGSHLSADGARRVKYCTCQGCGACVVVIET